MQATREMQATRGILEKQKRQEMQAITYDLGVLGNLISVKVISEGMQDIQEGKDEIRLPRVILVLDCSGSMKGNVGQIVNDWFPHALIKEGYDPQTPADVVAFSDDAFLLTIQKTTGKGTPCTPTLQDLTHMRTDALNGTQMAGVFRLLQKIIVEDPKSAFLIVAVSDGEIQDTHVCLAEVKKVAPTLSFAQVKVCMVRLQTSSWANPDTRALASIGLLDTSTDSSIHDIMCGDVVSFGCILSEAIQQSSKGIHVVSSRTNSLRRLPSDAPTNRLTFAAERFVFLAGDTTSVECDGKALTCTKKSFDGYEDQKLDHKLDHKLDDEVLRTFCEAVEHHVRFLQVAGLQTQVIVEWFSQLRDLISTASSASPEPVYKTRLQRILREARKTEKKCINEVLACAGEERVKSLNSAQQADYLRSTKNKKLAHRVEKYENATKEKSDAKQNVQFEALRAKILHEESSEKSSEEKSSEERSFYSLLTMREALKELFGSVNNDDLERMGILGLVRLIGHVGLGYSACVGDLVDPYTFRVEKIFETPLSCNDLREANSQKSHGECYVLKPPAHNNDTITGVVPIRFFQPDLFDLIPVEIQRAHASINMRKMLAPVQNDMIAERLAVLTCIMRENQTRAFPEWLQRAYDDVLAQLKTLFSEPSVQNDFKTITDPLKGFFTAPLPCHEAHDTLRAQWIGRNGVSCVWKVFVPLLCDESFSASSSTVSRISDKITDILSMLYELDAYFIARRTFNDQDERDKALRSIFEIDEKRVIEAVPLESMPTFEDDLESKFFIADQVREYAQSASECVEMNVDTILAKCLEKCKPWMPSIDNYLAYAFRMTKNAVFEKNNVAIALLAAVACPNETDRIEKTADTNKMLTFSWCDKSSQENYVKALGRRFYAAHYEKKANEELKIRSAKAFETSVHLMIATTSFSEFVYLLGAVPNREHGVYVMLLRRASELSLVKLRVLLTGRDNKGNHIWGRENTFDPSLRAYSHLFKPEEWRDIFRNFEEAPYLYRESDKPNSHGHCNSKPSLWATSGAWKLDKSRRR
jgi:hypothetical protein